MSKYIAFFAAVLIGSCAGPKPISFLNDRMDLRDYKTYKLIVFKSDENFDVQGMVFFNQLEKAIMENMDKRLFDPSERPDLIVRYEIVSSQRTENQKPNYYDPYSFYTPQFNRTISYTEAILLIEFRDRRKKKLVWQGSLDIDLTKSKPEDLIYNAVNQVFTTYPYQAGSYDEVNLTPTKK